MLLLPSVIFEIFPNVTLNYILFISKFLFVKKGSDNYSSKHTFNNIFYSIFLTPQRPETKHHIRDFRLVK